MEHGKMSLSEALNMGIGFLELYKNSDAFKRAQRATDHKANYQASVLSRLEAIIKVSSRR